MSMTSAKERAVEAGARAMSAAAGEEWHLLSVTGQHRWILRSRACVRAALLSMAGHLSDVVNCHSDDRPRRDGIDWNDGYQDGCKGAALALRARIQQMAEAL